MNRNIKVQKAPIIGDAWYTVKNDDSFLIACNSETILKEFTNDMIGFPEVKHFEYTTIDVTKLNLYTPNFETKYDVLLNYLSHCKNKFHKSYIKRNGSNLLTGIEVYHLLVNGCLPDEDQDYLDNFSACFELKSIVKDFLQSTGFDGFVSEDEAKFIFFSDIQAKQTTF